MTTLDLNNRLWSIAKWGLPLAVVLFIVAAIFKLRMFLILVDIFGLFIVGVITFALLTELLLYTSKKPADAPKSDTEEDSNTSS